MKKTSIIIVTYNNFNYTKDCIDSIRKYTEKGTYEIIIIDNLSTDETREWLSRQNDIKVILNDENKGFPKACNQGIEIANINYDILLLNNDTIVTTNWLSNLNKCLYSSDLIGAVGAVCNHNENLQGCDFTYDDFDTMQSLARKNNISDSSRWEEKVFLIGYCLLIKREVINKIGLLDEEYSPGYIDDNDLSLRIIEVGYKLMLCHDVFIHHYLGSAFRKDLNKFYPILYKNREYFENKWGFDTFSFDDIKHASLRLLDDEKDKELCILELNCGIGATILKIKNSYPNASIDGIDANDKKVSIVEHFANAYQMINNEFPDTIKESSYDYIIIGDILEHIKEPNEFIKYISKYLNKNGKIIGEIHNIANYHNILSLLNDNWYSNNHNINSYTISDINQLFEQNGFKQIRKINWLLVLSDDEKIVLDKLQNIIPNKKDESYMIHYYAFKFQKIDD